MSYSPMRIKRIVLLEIKELTFGYKNSPLLYKDFSLKLNSGEATSIVGASGSGKSTLFELISGNLKPLKGTIENRGFSQVFQDPYSSFHHSYSILNQIKDVASLDDLEKLLDQLYLERKLLEKKPYELSGGQLQRASILRALLMKPELLLLDEPTSALDNITQLEVMKLLVKQLENGIGMLLITHDLDLAKWFSDSVITLSER